MGLGFTVGDSNAAGGFGLNGAVGGLGALLQGFLQGRQMKLQNEQVQQQIQGEKTRNAAQVFSMLQGLSPEQLQSPFAREAAQSVQGTGVPSLLGQDGNIDPRLFQQDLGTFASSPLYMKVLSLAPNDPMRQALLAHAPISDDDRATLLKAPQEYSPAQQDNANTALSTLNRGVQSGVIDANDPNFVATYNRNAAIAGLPPWEGSGSTGVATQAKVASLQAGTEQKNAQAQLTRLKAKYYPKMADTQIQQMLARTNLTNEQFQLLPQEVRDKTISADAAASKAASYATDVGLKVADVKKLGMTPSAISAFRGLQDTTRQGLNYYRLATSSSEAAVNEYVKNVFSGAAPTLKPSVDDSGNPIMHPVLDANGKPVLGPDKKPVVKPVLVQEDGTALTPAQQRYVDLQTAADNARKAQQDYATQTKPITDGFKTFSTNVIKHLGGKDTWRADGGGDDNGGGGGVTLTQAQFAAAAKAHHMTLSAAKAYARTHGITVVP